jgi:hypothetical protein
MKKKDNKIKILHLLPEHNHPEIKSINKMLQQNDALQLKHKMKNSTDLNGQLNTAAISIHYKFQPHPSMPRYCPAYQLQTPVQ